MHLSSIKIIESLKHFVGGCMCYLDFSISKILGCCLEKLPFSVPSNYIRLIYFTLLCQVIKARFEALFGKMDLP